jgi:hypothetical protein
VSVQETDFFSQYLSYCSNAEPPAIFNRWALIASIGAKLGRQYYFEHGHFIIHPNMYTMLIGSAGTRKSSAIKLAKKLLIASDYQTIAADKSTKEKFLLDLSGEEDPAGFDGKTNGFDVLEENLFGAGADDDKEIFIMADEFNDFFGNNILDFISLLGNLWDYSGDYKSRIKNGKSISIHNPTVSILGGNTPTNLASAFPPESLGQGFFSRILLIYGEPNGKRITFPKPPDPSTTERIVSHLREIKQKVQGTCNLSSKAEGILDSIYQRNLRVDDVRFDAYSNRRFNHLIKLCLIVSASRLSITITEHDVIYANTILTHAERFMPKALGQFGKAKNSDVTHKVLEVISSSDLPLSLTEIWLHVSNDLDKIHQLSEILVNLREAGKIQFAKEVGGFLPIRKIIEQSDDEYVDFSLLTDEERSMRS